MNDDFVLNQTQLCDIAIALKEKISEGVQHFGKELRCFPTYIPIMQVPENGRALVVEFGGHTVRSALVSLTYGKFLLEKGPVMNTIPYKPGVPLERDDFLEVFARTIMSLDPPAHIPVGYCFSYPAAPTLEGDARLIKWTKEFHVQDMVRENMGEALLDHLSHRSSPLRCSKVAVINDTVASLLAGLTVAGADGYIGLIVGNGNNIAAIMEPEEIPKIPEHFQWTDPVPVNLESGNFSPPHLTRWDALLDACSENPGQQQFEKAMSGAYLARLMRTIVPESRLDTAATSKAVNYLAYESKEANQHEREIARQLLTRSAELVAASLAGVIAFLNTEFSRNSFCIVVEGGLFWKALYYEETTRTTLKTILKEMGLERIVCQFVAIPHANFLGSAIAALSGNFS